MILNTYIAGAFDANNYLLMDKVSKEAVLIDCSEYKQRIIEDITKLGAKVKCILLTHGHFDHVLGVNEMTKALNVDAYINQADIILTDNINNMVNRISNPPVLEVPDIKGRIQDWQEFTIGEHRIKAIPTPGHTEGGVCYLIDGKLFSGDTLFRDSYGRTDLFGGDFEKIRHSLLDIIFKLYDNIRVFPGHGPATTIGYEKVHNEINR